MPLAIVGPTAVGKSELAIALAKLRDGEVVSVDSRCVYRGMDVGTAKPTPAERRGVKHHLIDVVDPGEEYSVARFLEDAARAVDDITARGKLPILVGGTGYWLRALLGGLTSADVPRNHKLRAELEALSIEALGARLSEVDAVAAGIVDPRNPRRLIRAIEVVEATGRPYAEAAIARPLRWPVKIVGLTLPRPILYERIDARYERMVAAGWVDEVRRLLVRYPEDAPPLRSFGYAEIAAHVRGELTLPEALTRAKIRCRRYARSQYSWFRLDDPTIEWHDAREAIA